MNDQTRRNRGTQGEAMSERTVNLYCWACDNAHRLTLSEAEQLVYVLLASAADEALDQPRQGADPAFDYINDTCLLDQRAMADDIEAYAEHVQQGVEARRHAGRSKRPRTSWRDSVIDEHLGMNRQR